MLLLHTAMQEEGQVRMQILQQQATANPGSRPTSSRSSRTLVPYNPPLSP